MSDDAVRVEGPVTVPGTARGPALVLDEPLSFWGGVEAASGRIVRDEELWSDVG